MSVSTAELRSSQSFQHVLYDCGDGEAQNLSYVDHCINEINVAGVRQTLTFSELQQFVYDINLREGNSSKKTGYNGSEGCADQMPTASYMETGDSSPHSEHTSNSHSAHSATNNSRSPASEKEFNHAGDIRIKKEKSRSPQANDNNGSRGKGYPGIFLSRTNPTVNGVNPAVTLESWNMPSVPLPQSSMLKLSTQSENEARSPHATNGRFSLLIRRSSSEDSNDSPLAKRMRRLETSSKKQTASFDWQPQSPTNATVSGSSCSSVDNGDLKRRRFLRTREALERSGLLNVTMRTADLIKSNYVLNKQIQELKKQTAELLKSIFSSPENEQVSKKSLNILQTITELSLEPKQEAM